MVSSHGSQRMLLGDHRLVGLLGVVEDVHPFLAPRS
jgi:hypothetical protein